MGHVRYFSIIFRCRNMSALPEYSAKSMIQCGKLYSVCYWSSWKTNSILYRQIIFKFQTELCKVEVSHTVLKKSNFVKAQNWTINTAFEAVSPKSCPPFTLFLITNWQRRNGRCHHLLLQFGFRYSASLKFNVETRVHWNIKISNRVAGTRLAGTLVDRKGLNSADTGIGSQYSPVTSTLQQQYRPSGFSQAVSVRL